MPHETAPRWEWRAFGRRFGPAEVQLATAQPQGTDESDELYLLNGAHRNVKVRGGLLDVKVLRQVSTNGLEQWDPVAKAPLPLAADDAHRIADALQLPPDSLRPRRYTCDEFVEALSDSATPLRAVKVHKRRSRYLIGGCMAELADVIANNHSSRTIAVESEDAAAVMRSVRELGLAGYENISYPRGLAALAGGEPTSYAAIDVGTNSVKLHVSERRGDGSWRALLDRVELTRLGEGLEQRGLISDTALERTAAAISGMVDEAKQHGVLAIVAVGTDALRVAANRNEALDAIEARTGLRIEVLSGEEEGRLAYLGASSGLALPSGTLVVFDTGGGSTQFTFGHDAIVDERFSVEVGAVRYTERYKLDSAVSQSLLQQAMADISAALVRIERRPLPGLLVGMGGTVTNLSAVKHGLTRYDPNRVQGSILDLAEIDRQIELYRCRDADARRTLIGLQPKRAEVILAGACIVRTVMAKLGMQTLIVSDRSLRHGVLAERFAASDDH